MSRIIFSKKSLTSSIEGDIKVNSKATADTYSLTTIDHDKLKNRDLADQHPISAITGLNTIITQLESGVEEATNKATIAESQATIAITKAEEALTNHLYEYLVYFNFNKSGTGAAYYSVYFTLKSTIEYDPQEIDFAILRNMIIANGDHVQCSCQTAGPLDMNIISTSTNAGDDTIMVDCKSGDFYEFYSFSDLEDYSITKLNY